MKRKTMNDFFYKRRIVKNGESEIFKQWFCQGVSQTEFLKGLEWLCEDTCFAGNHNNLESRELCLLTNGRIAKLYRQYRKDDSFAGLYDTDSRKIDKQYILDSFTCKERI